MEAPMPDLDPEFREIVDNNFWDMMEAPMNVLERKRVKCSAFKSEVNTHRNAAPINAETVRELMDERDRLRAELEAARAENEQLNKELACANDAGRSLVGNLLPAIEYLQTHGQEHGIEWGGSITEWIGDNLPQLIKELAAERERREKAECALTKLSVWFKDHVPCERCPIGKKKCSELPDFCEHHI
jgi:hypothetical protein